MGQTYETAGRTALAGLETKQPYELLIQLGGAMTILLSAVLTAIQWSQGIAANQLTAVATFLVLNVVLGGALWVASRIVTKNQMNGAIVAALLSAILIAFAGQPGLIGGLVGIFGAVLAVAAPYMPRAHRK